MNKIQLTFECTPFEAQEVARLLDGMRKIEELAKVPPVKVSEKIIVGKTMMPELNIVSEKKEDKRKYNGLKKNRWKKSELNLISRYVAFGDIKAATNDQILLKNHGGRAIYYKFRYIKKINEKAKTNTFDAKEYLPKVEELARSQKNQRAWEPEPAPKKWFKF